MIFTPELAGKVLAGEKTVTRRATSQNPASPWYEGGCQPKKGSVCAVQPGRGKPAIGRVRILSVGLVPLAISDDEARREGFASAQAFVEGWTQINGSYDAETLVWRLEFELVRGGSG